MAASQDRSNRRGGSRNGRGFTLIELLTSMAIMLILAGMVVGAGVLARNAATRAKARAELQELHNALQAYRIERGEYPKETDINRVRTNLPTKIQAAFNKRHMTLFLDVWQRQFVYTVDPNNPETYVLYSKGPNQTNTTDDIYSGK